MEASFILNKNCVGLRLKSTIVLCKFSLIFFSRVNNWIGHVLPGNCFLKHVIERNIEPRIEVMVRRGRRGKQLLDELKEERVYWILKEEELGRNVWRTSFARKHGPVLRQKPE